VALWRFWGQHPQEAWLNSGPISNPRIVLAANQSRKAVAIIVIVIPVHLIQLCEKMPADGMA
jgi:hypothetical protein